MKRNELSCGLLPAMSIALVTVVGCGGSGNQNGNQHSPALMPLSGGVTTISGICPTAVTAGSNPQEVLLVPNGGISPIVVTIPAGISVAAGQSVAILPANTVYFQNMTGGKPGTRQTPDPGNITINNQPTGLSLASGLLSGNMALPKGAYTEVDAGPYSFHAAGLTLTVQCFIWQYDSDGTTLSLPQTANGLIPSNGTELQGASITLKYDLTWGNSDCFFELGSEDGNVMQKDKVAPDGSATIRSQGSYIHSSTMIPLDGLNYGYEGEVRRDFTLPPLPELGGEPIPGFEEPPLDEDDAQHELSKLINPVAVGGIPSRWTQTAVSPAQAKWRSAVRSRQDRGA